MSSFFCCISGACEIMKFPLRISAKNIKETVGCLMSEIGWVLVGWPPSIIINCQRSLSSGYVDFLAAISQDTQLYTAGAICNGNPKSRNRTRRHTTQCPDPIAITQAAPVSNYFTFCKQTTNRHMKLISTLESRRRNCYFA